MTDISTAQQIINSITDNPDEWVMGDLVMRNESKWVSLWVGTSGPYYGHHKLENLTRKKKKNVVDALEIFIHSHMDLGL